MYMNERILTVLLSAAATAGVMKLAPEHKELTVERLIVTKELIVSDTGQKVVEKSGYVPLPKK